MVVLVPIHRSYKTITQPRPCLPKVAEEARQTVVQRPVAPLLLARVQQNSVVALGTAQAARVVMALAVPLVLTVTEKVLGEILEQVVVVVVPLIMGQTEARGQAGPVARAATGAEDRAAVPQAAETPRLVQVVEAVGAMVPAPIQAALVRKTRSQLGFRHPTAQPLARQAAVAAERQRASMALPELVGRLP
jgi:hypothetical protein